MSPIIDPTSPVPPFRWPMSAAVLEMAVKASVAKAEAVAHVQDEYDAWHWEAREQSEAIEEFCEEIIDLEDFGPVRSAELRYALDCTFRAAAAAHLQECSVCALEKEHALLLTAAS